MSFYGEGHQFLIVYPVFSLILYEVFQGALFSEPEGVQGDYTCLYGVKIAVEIDTDSQTFYVVYLVGNDTDVLGELLKSAVVIDTFHHFRKAFHSFRAEFHTVHNFFQHVYRTDVAFE